MCDAEHALSKDMVKALATWLNSEVQRPTMQALERTKTARAELAERARANSELMSAEKRMVGPAQLNELREKMQRCDMHARQSLEEVSGIHSPYTASVPVKR
jgi:predicted deacetylase